MTVETARAVRLHPEHSGSIDEVESSRTGRIPASAGIITVVLLAVVGFALIGYTWFQVSDLTNSAKQIPYLVSGGLTGLGLVVLSAAGLVVVTRAPDESQRQDQTTALISALERIEHALGSDVDKP